MVLNIYDLDRDLNKGDFGLHQKRTIIGLGLGLWCLMLLSTIFQLHRGGGNRSTRRKPLTCRKSLTNIIT
jgi:hypothetical protein